LVIKNSTVPQNDYWLSKTQLPLKMMLDDQTLKWAQKNDLFNNNNNNNNNKNNN